MDFRYPISTLLGILRLVQFVLGILVLICIGSAKFQDSANSFVYFVATASLITSFVISILYIIHMPESGPCARLPWNLMEFGFLSLWAVLYFICGIITAVSSGQWSCCLGNMQSSYGAASFFCFAAAIVYGISAFLYFRRWRFGTTESSATVERRTTTTTTEARYWDIRYQEIEEFLSVHAVFLTHVQLFLRDAAFESVYFARSLMPVLIYHANTRQ